MTNSSTYYLTTPIYYVNGEPHIGHAYTSIMCDILARFKRLDGAEVMLLTGTDEHGQKVAEKAENENITPQQLADRNAENFRAMSEIYNISDDDFIRTTEPRHIKAAQAMWQKMLENGDIYMGKYAGWYAVRDEAYYAESELEKGTDGNYYYPESGAQVEWVEEPSFFFKLSAWQDRLLQFYKDHPDCILPKSRYNEVISFVEGGLQDLSISRTTFNWGVPVPDHPDHVMYVWVDALTNYITAIDFPDESSERFKKFWPADLHMVGKDILRFHAVYWPAFLMAAKLEPPKRIFAHGWWTNKSQKMSKSLGNAIDPKRLKETYGLDAMRYYLAREITFGEDGDYSDENMIRRINTDLSNDLGNLAQRILSIVAKHCESKTPQPENFTAEDQAMMAAAHDLLPKVRTHMDVQAFEKALRQIWEVISDANKYVDAQAPWALRKTDFNRMQTVLYVVMETLRCIGILIQPVMPESASKLLNLLGVEEENRNFTFLTADHVLKPGTSLPTPEAIFPRYTAEAA